MCIKWTRSELSSPARRQTGVYVLSDDERAALDEALQSGVASNEEVAAFWKRHGIEQAGFWTTAIGDSNQALYYLLKWESLADREKKWNAFQADPEWHTKRAETEKNGAIVARVENSILQATSFSSVT